jgi:hypothetical protein
MSSVSYHEKETVKLQIQKIEHVSYARRKPLL